MLLSETSYRVSDPISILLLWTLSLIWLLFSQLCEGLTLRRYPEDLQNMMSSLMVAPMATKFLFWKKVCTCFKELP